VEKFNINIFNKNLKTNYIGKKIIYLNRIDSTNSFASRIEKNIDTNTKYRSKPVSTNSSVDSKIKLNKAEELNGLLILAEIQEKGRGRFNRQWISPAGGLWFTIVLKTNIQEKNLPKITLLSSISIAEVLKKDYKIDIKIKWPNDIYSNNFKLCGILCETEKIESLVFLNIGVGINVNNSTDEGYLTDIKAISIKSILGKDILREVLLAKILKIFEKNYDYYLKSGDFQKIFNKIKNHLIL
jgi:BirA family transcriptional regulator, biotin operon repressor / biotin---[acetyl-CoA-carboxylase] ligase